MEKNMEVNFEYLRKRVVDSFTNTDLKHIRDELSKIKDPTIICGVGGSSVVSDITSKIINRKNRIITTSKEPRDMLYTNLSGYENVISCSYSGNNFGVDMSFQNNLKHYLLTNNQEQKEGITNLTYSSTIDKERSFISLGATLVPVSILMSYYLNGETSLIEDQITETAFTFETDTDAYEIFTGLDTSTTSKYLESTFVESGIGIPIIHDKYSYCHGRSTTSINFNNTAIYLNRNTELDKLLLRELPKYYKQVIVIESKFSDNILDDYQMLIQAMYLTKYLAQQQGRDLSKVEYSPLVKQLYKFNGNL